MSRILFTILLILAAHVAPGQGKILLVGGGTEYRQAWSDEPYTWAIAQSANKKVAIIGYYLGSEPQWLPDYFLELGAAAAENFLVNSKDLANEADLITRLEDFDVFFFKGGDQSRYYQYYNDSELEKLLIRKFSEGAVMAGTSAGAAMLAGIAYTAENDSAYPDEVLKDVYHRNITLRTDFLPFLPGVIVDTHFIERGRMGRLLGFLAHHYLQTGEQATGIGVDDRTALAIDANKIATAMGSASVSIYRDPAFTQHEGTLDSGGVEAIQLLHGQQFDLKTMLPLPVDTGAGFQVKVQEEQGNYTVFLNGETGLSQNQDFLAQLVEFPALNDSILLVSPNNSSAALAWKNWLQNNSNLTITHLSISAAANAPDSAAARNHIRRSGKILFIDNNPDQLLSFLQNGPTGEVLLNQLFRNQMVTAFAGDDAKLAGKTWVTNETGNPLNSYRQELTFQPGIGLLPTTAIITDTYDPSSSDFYENKVSALFYQLVNDSLRFGLFLQQGNYIQFNAEEGSNFFHAYGNIPVILVDNVAEAARLNDFVNRNGDQRMVVGYDLNLIMLIGNGHKFKAGSVIIKEDPPLEFEEEPVVTSLPILRGKINLYPNPTDRFLKVPPQQHPVELNILDQQGKSVLKRHLNSEKEIDLLALPAGKYFLQIRSNNDLQVISFIKK